MKELFESWRSYLNEAIIDNVKKRFPEHEQEIDLISKNDPSGKDKYLTWAAHQIFRQSKDIKEVILIITKFDKSGASPSSITDWDYKELKEKFAKDFLNLNWSNEADGVLCFLKEKIVMLTPDKDIIDVDDNPIKIDSKILKELHPIHEEDMIIYGIDNQLQWEEKLADYEIVYPLSYLTSEFSFGKGGPKSGFKLDEVKGISDDGTYKNDLVEYKHSFRCNWKKKNGSSLFKFKTLIKRGYNILELEVHFPETFYKNITLSYDLNSKELVTGIADDSVWLFDWGWEGNLEADPDNDDDHSEKLYLSPDDERLKSFGTEDKNYKLALLLLERITRL